MEKSTAQRNSILQLTPLTRFKGFTAANLTPGRYLVGRTESCEIIIPRSDISAIHAVIEVSSTGVTVYDMNSKNGTFVGGSKVVAQAVNMGDTIKFGSTEFKINNYSAAPDLPPVLDTLEPISGPASVIRSRTSKPTPPANLPKSQPIIENDVEDKIPYIIYPLSTDPKSDYSEYIFEDVEHLYPIFKYELNKQAVEVIILFKDKVFSVDYLPEKDGIFKMAGVTQKKGEIEFPYLGKTEILPFVEVNKGNVIVNKLHNYDLLHLKGKEIITKNDGIVNLIGNDIVKLENGDLEIYVRLISAPPKVKPAPLFSRDKDLRKYILLVFFMVLIPVLALNFITVDKEKEDDKDPERIATILYKEKILRNVNKTEAKTQKIKEPKKQTAPKKPVAQKKPKPVKTKAPPVKSNSAKTPTPNPGSKSAKKVQKVKRVDKPAPKKTNVSKVVKTRTKTNTRSASQRTRSASRSAVQNNSKGRVETYKSFDFKSSVSNLMAKGGQIRGARVRSATSGSISSGGISGGVAESIAKANVGTEIGSLSGSTDGKIGTSKGTAGLATKTGTYTAGIPSETVVLGSMDPDVIRRILRDNIPFFRSCYQKELDSKSGRNVSGTIRLVFTIGASGHVSRAGVDGQTKLPPKVKRCVVGVLRGIQFPRPLGGGTVDVKQPFNFYPKRL